MTQYKDADQIRSKQTVTAVEYPSVGDIELDSMSGIIRVIGTQGLNNRAAVRVLRAVLERYESAVNSDLAKP